MTATELQIKQVQKELADRKKLKILKLKLANEVARDAAREVLGKPDEAVQRIITLSCAEFGASEELVMSRARMVSIVLVRQVAMALSREFTDHSFMKIGAMFSRDHGTVIHAIKAVQNWCDTNPAFSAKLTALRERVKGGK